MLNVNIYGHIIKSSRVTIFCETRSRKLTSFSFYFSLVTGTRKDLGGCILVIIF